MTIRNPLVCRLFRIEGRVQGVWFRESTRRQAESLKITGYAKNLPDGAVEVLACGEPAALDRLADWLRQGPPMAQVGKVGWVETEDERPDSFRNTLTLQGLEKRVFRVDGVARRR